ncbi:hypothetical protein [Candidatus Palauibacter sp.]|uniref:hypothetical protein n=1 Tax=Candidatus Palauibacter sp. TaxID=3101350 RepID=UPI003B018548
MESDDLRRAWANEASDFTPWLAENLECLESVLGIELEYVDREVSFGSYRADILARDPRDDSTVLIENQLEHANLQHLGQVLTYLAGLKADTVVWIAKDFGEGHLSAIRWLNEHTDNPFAFFAVRVRVVKIGDSPLAPVFDVLEQPNDWDRRVRERARSGELSGRRRFQREFWAHLNNKHSHEVKLGSEKSHVYRPTVQPAGLRVCRFLEDDRVGVYFAPQSGKTWTWAKPQIERFQEPLREALDGEKLFGELGATTFLETDTSDRANWDLMADWLHERRVIYERVLQENSG